MILADVNVLIYAFRTDSLDHRRYKQWLDAVVNGPAPYAVSPQVNKPWEPSTMPLIPGF